MARRSIRPSQTLNSELRELCLGWVWTAALPPLALAAGIFFSYSFAGLAWPLAIAALWSLTQPAVRRALRPRALLRLLLRPAVLISILVLAGLAVVATVVGPFGFASSFNKVAGSNTYGPVSPIEALGIWPTTNYRLDAAGGAPSPASPPRSRSSPSSPASPGGSAAANSTIPVALGACAVLYLVSLPFAAITPRPRP